MSKASLDADIYGDIYGDEAFDTAEDDPEAPEDVEDAEADDGFEIITRNEESTLTVDALTSSKDSKAPSDDGSSTNSKDENGLSYSAQIAQQFSAYQQTPSQERQQRAAMKTAAATITSNQNAPAPIATLDSSTSGEVAYGKKPSEMHDHGKLFIGGLSWDTTDEGLAKYFSQFGKVDAVTIMRDPSGTSRGFAFLTYEDGSAVNSVITKEHTLDGKIIDPKRAIPREEHLRNTRYFVGGLASNTTSESMKEFFTAFGKVVDATVMVDRDTGRSKGFGFVTFEDANNTDQLIGKALVMDDKQIEIKAAQPRSQRDQARNAMTPSPVGGATTNRGESFENRLQGANVPFVQQNPNPMAMMLQAQRTGGAMGMGGMNQMSMNMNPMAMMNMMGGMGNMGGMNMMNNMGGMGGAMMNNMGMMGGGMGNMGMGGMGANMGMNNMQNMGGVGNMANMNGMNLAGGMRLGMGPMGNQMMGMGMRQGMNNGMAARMQTNTGVGPLRMNNRGQHSFHPYSR